MEDINRGGQTYGDMDVNRTDIFFYAFAQYHSLPLNSWI